VDQSAIPDWAAATVGQRQTAQDVAVYVVWALSGRRFGVCTVTARPVDPGTRWCTQLQPGGAPLDGWRLDGPVVAVDEVLIDGAVIDPATYREHAGIVWLTSGALWPASNDLSLDPSEPGTWQITYQRGRPVPAAGNWAATVLTRELLSGIMGGPGACPRIPSRAQSVVREGVAIQLVDPVSFIDNGRTGIGEVDTFLAAVNPNQLMAPPVVWSPDVDQTGLVSPYLPAGEWWWRL
jgi:hypothetical protein